MDKNIDLFSFYRNSVGCDTPIVTKGLTPWRHNDQHGEVYATRGVALRLYTNAKGVVYGNVKLRYKKEGDRLEDWQLADYQGVTIPTTLGKPILTQIAHLQEDPMKGIMTSDMYLHCPINLSTSKDEFLVVPKNFERGGAQLVPGIYYMKTAAKEAVLNWDSQGRVSMSKSPEESTYALVMKGRVEGTISVPKSGSFKIGALDFDDANEAFEGILGMATNFVTRGENQKPLVPHITETNSGPVVLGLHDLFSKIAADRGEDFKHPRPEITTEKYKGKYIYQVGPYLTVVGSEEEASVEDFFMDIE